MRQEVDVLSDLHNLVFKEKSLCKITYFLWKVTDFGLEPVYSGLSQDLFLFGFFSGIRECLKPKNHWRHPNIVSQCF